MVKSKFCISSLLTKSAGVMKSKLFPQCKQRIHPVLNIYYLLFFNRMILNSRRHTQPDPQSCRVRSLGGAKGGSPKTNNASRDQKQNWAVQTQTQKQHVAAESAPHRHHVAKACDNNTQTIPNNIVPRNPAIPLHLQKFCFLVKLGHFSQKGHCSYLIFGFPSGIIR